MDFLDIPSDDRQLSVITYPFPFSTEQKKYTIVQGQSVSDILRSLGMGSLLSNEIECCVYVNRMLLRRNEWDSFFPKAGSQLSVNIIPQGGGDTGKNILRAVALIAVVAFAYYAAPVVAGWLGVTSQAGIGLITAGLTMLGSLAVNALIPPPSLDIGGGDTPSLGTQQALLGTTNRELPYGELPNWMGRNRIYPPFAVKTYTESLGSDVYARMLFFIGIGEYNVSEHKIGQTDIANFDDYEIVDGNKDDITSIYPNTVYEAPKSVQLLQSEGWATDTTQTDTEEISLDVTFPQGLWVQHDSGKIHEMTTTIEAEYQEDGDSAWTPFPDSPMEVRDLIYDRFSVGFRKSELPASTYNVRVKKSSGGDHPPYDSGSIVEVNDCYWTTLRSIKYTPPWNLDNCHLLALRIRISDQLNTQVNTFNVLAERKLPIYGESSGWTTTNEITRNPAWAFAEVLRGSTWSGGTGTIANRNPVPDSRINADDLLEWADVCTLKGLYCDGNVGLGRTVYDILQMIAATGRASRAYRNGKYTILMDETKTTTVQHFDDLNSWGYRGRRIYQDLPHAIDCRFRSEDSGYEIDQRIVYYDGYAAEADSAHEAATRFEKMELPLVTDPDQVWLLARYHMAVGYLRREIHTFNVDFEHMRCNRGDLVGFTRASIKVGLGAGRIKAVQTDSVGDITGVTMNNIISMEAGTSYACRIRKSNGNFEDNISIVNDPGEQTTIVFTTPITAADSTDVDPDVDDIVFFGVSGNVYQECLVNAIRYNPDFTASLELIEYNEAILNADSGTIPSYTPNITEPALILRIPPTPEILSVNVIGGASIGAALLGAMVVNLLGPNVQSNRCAYVTFSVSIGVKIEPEYFEAQWRVLSDDSPAEPGRWNNLANIPLDQRSFYVPVENGKTYDFRIRSVSRFGEISSWDTEADYEVDYSPVGKPDDVTGLALVQGGSTYKGGDIEITWDLNSDLWRVQNYLVHVYKTDGMVFLRDRYCGPSENFYSYTYQNNVEDNDGTPVSGITFRVWTIDYDSQTSDNYASLVVTAATPGAPSGLALIQGGSTFPGANVEVTWTPDTDPHWVEKYKIEVYKTSGLVLLRTEYRDVASAFYSYSFAKNEEDNSGTAITGLTFRVYATSYFGATSSASSLAVTNAAPANVSGTSAAGRIGAVEFTWSANSDKDLSHYVYRIQVESDGWSDWFKTTDNRTTRILTTTEKQTHGGDANIQIQVKAVDVFGQESAAADTANADALSLTIDATDIDDMDELSTLFPDVPVIQGLSLTNNSPSAGYVAWSACTVYLNGTTYSIGSGNTNNKYIYWKDLASSFAGTDTHPSELSGWLPKEDWIIATNVSGVGQKAISSIANQVIGSAWIKDLAVTNAKIAGSITVSKLASEVTDRLPNATAISAGKILLTSDGVTGVLGVGFTQAKCTDANADQTSANPQDLDWLDGSSGTLSITSSGNLQISAASGLSIESGGGMLIKSGAGITVQSGGSIHVDAGGDIILSPDTNNPSLLQFQTGSVNFSFAVRGDEPVYTDILSLFSHTAHSGSFYIGNDITGGGGGVFENLLFYADRILLAGSAASSAAQPQINIQDYYLGGVSSCDVTLSAGTGSWVNGWQDDAAVIRVGADDDGAGDSYISMRTNNIERLNISKAGAFAITGYVTITDYLAASGGVHVGGTSDPGTDNLLVDGTITVSGAGITMAEDAWIGIGSSSERIKFDGTAGLVSVMNATLMLGAQDGSHEGGEMRWQGAGTYDDWTHDLYNNDMRLFTNSANTNLVQAFNIGSGYAFFHADGFKTNEIAAANALWGSIFLNSADSLYHCKDASGVQRAILQDQAVGFQFDSALEYVVNSWAELVNIRVINKGGSLRIWAYAKRASGSGFQYLRGGVNSVSDNTQVTITATSYTWTDLGAVDMTGETIGSGYEMTIDGWADSVKVQIIAISAWWE